MFFFSKKQIDIDAAEKFWNWFIRNEQWIIDNVNTNGMDVVWAVDAQIKPVFPFCKRELEFQLGFNNGIGEFIFFHFGNKNLMVGADNLMRMMPAHLQKRWIFIAEK